MYKYMYFTTVKWFAVSILWLSVERNAKLRSDNYTNFSVRKIQYDVITAQSSIFIPRFILLGYMKSHNPKKTLKVTHHRPQTPSTKNLTPKTQF